MASEGRAPGGRAVRWEGCELQPLRVVDVFVEVGVVDGDFLAGGDGARGPEGFASISHGKVWRLRVVQVPGQGHLTEVLGCPVALHPVDHGHDAESVEEEAFGFGCLFFVDELVVVNRIDVHVLALPDGRGREDPDAMEGGRLQKEHRYLQRYYT